MGKALLKNLKESLLSILPLTLAVVVLALFPIVNISSDEWIRLVIAFFFLVIGMMLFNIGTNTAMLPMGEYLGATIVKKGRIILLIVIIFIIGFLITMVEPVVTIFGQQIPINTWTFVIFVSIGVGVFLVVSLLRIIFQWSQSVMFILGYASIFMLLHFVDAGYIPMAFDSSASTTGLLTIPIFMALGGGVAKTAGGAKSHEDSFGIIGGVTLGPILTVTILGIFIAKRPIYQAEVIPDVTILQDVLQNAFENAKSSIIVLAPLALFFLAFQRLNIRLPKKQIRRILIGLGITTFGIIFFLTGATIGYVPLGRALGKQLGEGKFEIVLLIGFLFGLVVAVAEPSVHVLSRQVEEVSDGAISFRTMVITLSIGLALSILLSLIRIHYKFSIIYYLVPGFALAIFLTRLVPNIYTGVAFDSGGAVSGPLAASFITPFVTGVALVNPDIPAHDLALYTLGTMAMVAMMPLVTIQILGLSTTIKTRLRLRLAYRRVYEADDELIIYFPIEEGNA
jgi:hypothetical protein